MTQTATRAIGLGSLCLCVVGWLPFEIQAYKRDREIENARARLDTVARQRFEDTRSATRQDIASGNSFDWDHSHVADSMRGTQADLDQALKELQAVTLKPGITRSTLMLIRTMAILYAVLSLMVIAFSRVHSNGSTVDLLEKPKV
jgi:hypothetical protein